MNELYPMKFTPVFLDKIWGGNRIKTKLGIDYGDLPNCGEAWMVSGYPKYVSVVSNGYLEGNELNELVEVYMGDLVGDKVYEQNGDQFPLIIKLLDSNDWLSIQVHPDDQLAENLKIGKGKTEMWYVLDAEKDAQLITGFNKPITREEYLEYFEKGKLTDILNFENVTKGDVFFIPPGRVHALGPGILLAEIQEASDATFRIYDWDRIDAAGLKRELHTDLALKAIDFEFYPDFRTHYKEQLNSTVDLVSCPYFTTNLLKFNKPIQKNFEELDSFVVYMAVEGNLVLEWKEGKINIKRGEVILIPNLIEAVNLIPEGEAKLLEIYVI